METADVVVVGAGIVGVSTAYFLARAGVHGVLVLERDTVAAGATGRAAGTMLLQDDAEDVLRFQLEGIRVHRQFQAEWGTDLAERGSLWLWCTPEDAARARALEPLHARLGIGLELLSPEEARARFPYLAVGDVALATWSAHDVWTAPDQTARRIADAARALGATIREHCEVIGIEIEGGRVQRVRTRDGVVATPVIVNAAGAGARLVCEMVGLRISVSPRKRQAFILDAAGVVPSDSPAIVERRKDLYCESRADGLIVVQGQTAGETLETAVEWGYLDDALDAAQHRIPGLRAAPIAGGWAGIRAMSADGRPFLGAAPGVDGYFVAGALGDRGIAVGALVGEVLADLITTGRSRIDLDPYRVGRVPPARASADHAGRAASLSRRATAASSPSVPRGHA